MAPSKILLVDPVARRRQALAKFLSGLDLDLDAAASCAEALAKVLSQNGYALLVLSLNSLQGDSIGVLEQLRGQRPQPGIILLSGLQNPSRALSLLRAGTVDQVLSPDHFLGIFSGIKAEVARQELLRENRHFSRNLTRLRIERSQNSRKAQELEETYDATLENLMTALDLRDVETFGHSQTVAKYSQVLAEILGVKDEAPLENIRKGALLHDIGKIAIPDSILKKPGPLTSQEWEKIKLHPSLGFGLIKEIKVVKEVGNIILYHHERYDGQGYPKGLKGDDIPFEARIFALADALDAITSHRPYRRERDFNAARSEIIAHSITQFDPKIVEGFCSLRPERWEKIRYETTRLLPCVSDFPEIKRGQV